MATVYLARDLRHHRPVGLKVLHPELALSLGADRFLREIEVAAGLTHPHILPVFDSGDAAGVLWYSMPYVEGESLRERLRREKQLPVEDALRIAGQVLAALSYAHEHGILHRDIKPENILLESGEAVVADFGIARAIYAAAGERFTDPGITLGTPAYMSPEQAAGEGDLDGRSDLYSVGCVLHEMLSGSPPFTGRTPAAVLARHMQDPPPSLRVVRPTVSPAVARAIETALAKVPADRYPTASHFLTALEAAAGQRRLRSRRRQAALLGGAVALWVAVEGWQLVREHERLDSRRLVVYPLAASGGGRSDTALAENVTDAFREALTSSRYVKVVDAWPLLDERERDRPRAVSLKRARAIARGQGSGFYVGGQILQGDSVRLFLRLEDLSADSSRSWQLVFGPTADAWSIGVRAARELLPLLIPAGRGLDLTSLRDLSPAATASFLQGERAYRRGRFKEALEHYRTAVRADSAFALAALKGAQSASWDGRLVEAKELIGLALAREPALAPRYAHFARGFEHFLEFRADSAVYQFRQVLALDPEWAEAWARLGEVYTHLLPRDSPVDSLAAAAFVEARRLDPTFAPVLYHLLETALRRGNARDAARLMEQFRRGQPDSVELVSTELMLQCVEGGPDAVDWEAATLRGPRFVTEAARSFMVGGLHRPACTSAAWEAILAYDTTSPPNRVNYRWGALLGLQSALLAQARYREVEQLLEQDTVFDPDLRGQLYILDAVAGADGAIESRASIAGNQLREAYRAAPSDMGSVPLWHLGIWEAHQGRGAEARAIGDTLAARAARSGDREEALLARSVTSRATLALGDSAGALRLLDELVPTAGRGALTWSPWESLGGERWLLARLRMARGEFAEAIRVARSFDAPAPVPYVLYLPASLELRLQAARAIRDEGLARRVSARLVALGRPELARDDRAEGTR